MKIFFLLFTFPFYFTNAANPLPKVKNTQDIDKEISNDRLRAESGSKSKLSGSLSAFYKGGAIETPLKATRPNLSGDPEVATQSEGGGSLSLRYRATKNHSFTLGTGFSFFQPFQDDKKYPLANDFQITNPVIGYSFIGKVGAFQSSTTTTLTYGTWDGWENLRGSTTDLESSIKISQNFTYKFKGTHFSAGSTFSLTLPKYSDSREDGLNRYLLGAFPFIEYKINKKFVARTVFGYFNLRNKRRYDNKFKMLRAYEFQSLGVGIVAARDIWIYPNIQFLPDNLSLKKSNFSLSLSMNIF